MASADSPETAADALAALVGAAFPSFESLAEAHGVILRHRAELAAAAANDANSASEDVALQLREQFVRDLHQIRADFVRGPYADLRRIHGVCSTLATAATTTSRQRHQHHRVSRSPSHTRVGGSPARATSVSRDREDIHSNITENHHHYDVDHNNDHDNDSDNDNKRPDRRLLVVAADDEDEGHLGGNIGNIGDNDDDEFLPLGSGIGPVHNYLRSSTNTILSSTDSLTSPLPLLTYKRTSVVTDRLPGAFSSSTLSPLAIPDENDDEDRNHDETEKSSALGDHESHIRNNSEHSVPYEQQNDNEEFNADDMVSEESLPDFTSVRELERLQIRLNRLVGVGTTVLALQDFDKLRTKIKSILLFLTTGQFEGDTDLDSYSYSPEALVLLYKQLVDFLKVFDEHANSFIISDSQRKDTALQNAAIVNHEHDDTRGQFPLDELSQQVTRLDDKDSLNIATFPKNTCNNELALAVLDIAMHAIATCEEVHTSIRGFLVQTQLKSALGALGWPKPIPMKTNEKLMTQWGPYLRRAVIDLVKLQIVELTAAPIVDSIQQKLENNCSVPPDFTKDVQAKITSPCILYPIHELLRAPILQFKYHFDSNSPTNRLDKPEWALKHLAKQFDLHFDFLTGPIEDAIIASGFYRQKASFGEKLEIMDASSQFIMGMIMVLRKKFMNDLETLLMHPQLLTETIAALVSFDIKLQHEYAYKGSLTAASVYLDDTYVFQSWIRMLRANFEEQVNSALESEDAFEVAFPGGATELESHTLTRAADTFITLQEALTEQYRLLDTSPIDRKVMMFTDVELPTLECFLKQIVLLQKEAKLSVYTANVRGTNAVKLLNKGALILVCRYSSTLDVVKNCLMDKDEIDQYIELWTKYVEKRDPSTMADTTSTDISSFPLQAVGALLDDSYNSDFNEQQSASLLSGRDNSSLPADSISNRRTASLDIPASAFTDIISIYDEYVRKFEASLVQYVFDLARFSLRDCVSRTDWMIHDSGDDSTSLRGRPISGRTHSADSTSNLSANVIGDGPLSATSTTFPSSGNTGRNGVNTTNVQHRRIPVQEIHPLLELFNEVLPILKMNLPAPSFYRVLNKLVNERLDEYILDEIVRRGRFTHEGAQLLRSSLHQWLLCRIMAKYISDTDISLGVNSMMRATLDTLHSM